MSFLTKLNVAMEDQLGGHNQCVAYANVMLGLHCCSA